MPVVRAEVSGVPIDLRALEDAVVTPHDGAVASFIGRVRDHDPEADGEVAELHYSAHPDAARMIVEIVQRAVSASDPEGLTRVAAVHRTGALAVGDLALVVVVASAHRGITFTVCAAVVEAVKHELPVWKRQVEVDGTHVWSGLPEVTA